MWRFSLTLQKKLMQDSQLSPILSILFTLGYIEPCPPTLYLADQILVSSVAYPEIFIGGSLTQKVTNIRPLFYKRMWFNKQSKVFIIQFYTERGGCLSPKHPFWIRYWVSFKLFIRLATFLLLRSILTQYLCFIRIIFFFL